MNRNFWIVLTLIVSLAIGGFFVWQRSSVGPIPSGQRVPKVPVRLLLSDIQRHEDAKLMAWLTEAQASAALKLLDREVLKPLVDDVNTRSAAVSALEVTPDQFPDLHRVVLDCARVLHLERTPRVFVADRPGLQILTENYTDPILIIHTAVLRRFKHSTELRFLIGRELGHVKAAHTRWLVLIRRLQSSLGELHGPAGRIIRAPLLPILCWAREAAMTADNAGLVCAQDLGASECAIVRMATGVDDFTLQSLNVDAFIQQAGTQDFSDFSEFAVFWQELNRPVPFAPDRIRQLREYHGSSRYKALWE